MTLSSTCASATHISTHPKTCEWCGDFVDLNNKRHGYVTGDDFYICPCHMLGDEALDRAREKLDEWDRGVHKWLKGLRKS